MPYYKPLKEISDEVTKQRIIDKLLLLRTKLDAEIPSKTYSETLLLATWNIREFGGNRQEESLHYLAEIASRFDLIAIQEVSADLAGLQKLLYLMGRNWDYIVTDSTEGAAGGNERIAFVYDTDKISFQKMAGEIVLPEDMLIVDKHQIARTPFCVAFQAGWFKFVLTSVHIYFGTESGEKYKRRVAEIAKLAEFLSKRAIKEDKNYILLGDFNITDTQSDTMKALTDSGFIVPEELQKHPSNIMKTKHYDQIAFKVKEDTNMRIFNKTQQKAGTFSFYDVVFKDDEMPMYRHLFSPKNTEGKTDEKIADYYQDKWRTFQMSDHLPLWVELKVDFSNQYLESLKKK
jgi:exonuclease III